VLGRKVDTEALTAIASRFGVRRIPTMILFRDGKEVERLSGAMPANALGAQIGI
jgi:thioredoxin 2